MLRLRAPLILSILLLSTVSATTAAATTLIRELPFEEVVARAARIVVGTVSDVRYGRDEDGAPATWIALDVSHSVRGAHAEQLTIKQFGVAEPLPDGTLARVPGIPQYTLGEEVVLFLRGESSRGFTSPVGFAQGVYKIDRDHGPPFVGRDSPGRAPEELDAFLARVKRLAGQAR